MGIKTRLQTIYSEWADEQRYQDNLDAVCVSNRRMCLLYDALIAILLSIMFVSTYFSDYALTLRYVYLAFMVESVIELLLLKNRNLSNSFIRTWTLTVVAKAYLFCILSSVVFNRSEPAITFFVFEILLPVTFVTRNTKAALVQLISLSIFIILVIALKTPDMIVSDVFSSVIFTIISIIVGAQVSGNRLERADLYRTTRIEQKRVNEIFNTTPVGILQLLFNENEVHLLFYNQAISDLFGYTNEELMGKKKWEVKQVIYPEDIPVVFASIADPYPGKIETYDFRLFNRITKSYRWVSCKFKITSVTKEGTTVLANLLDVDEKKRMESESEAKSRFLSRMSHEIRTPINAILGMAELQRQELSSKQINANTLLEYANETTSASKYLLTLVNDVLDTSRIENNKIELHAETIFLEPYLKQIANLIQPLAENKKLQFQYEQCTHLHEAYQIDGVRLQQILVNILNNAIKFTPAEGIVALKAMEVAGEGNHTTLKFEIKDTGIGMSQEFLAKLFQPFAQANTATTSPFEGTGLGLNIAKALALKMNGDITCTSEEGEGTTFTITVQAENTTTKVEPTPSEHVSVAKEYDFSGIRILLCEDHPLNQKITTALLARKHCEVEIADNGRIGLEMFEKSQPNTYQCILMDIRMPEMDGLETTAAIRALDRPDAKSIPIIAMSANAFAEDIEKSIQAGMNEHLAKPVDVNLLYQTIAQVTNAEEVTEMESAILVVDDIEMNAAIVANILKSSYETFVATSGKQALECLASHNNILGVITDIQMPDMDGLELIQTIRKNPKYDSIAILANTQYGDAKQTENLLAIGADDFVYKASSPMVLVNRLKNVLARHLTIRSK